jgi:hypothetical protein
MSGYELELYRDLEEKEDLKEQLKDAKVLLMKVTGHLHGVRDVSMIREINQFLEL